MEGPKPDGVGHLLSSKPIKKKGEPVWISAGATPRDVSVRPD